MPGNLPIDHVTTVANLLKPFTQHPDQMWYLVWEGYGERARGRKTAEEICRVPG